jgi:amino acid adenylation domain-containing protein
MLGIMKAGAAYLPLDPAYPGARLDTILADARPALVISSRDVAESLPGLVAQQHLLFEPDLEPAAVRVHDVPLIPLSGANLAYVIYTSGSTGNPKGVAIQHRNAVALLLWAREAFTPEECRAVVASTSVCFDLSVYEIFLPLISGGYVILVSDALDIPNGGPCDGASIINTVPIAIEELVGSGWVPPAQVTVNSGGEALKRAVVDKAYRAGDVRRVVNAYGPTETTVYSSYEVERRGEVREPGIGRPISNTRMYVVGEGSEPAAVGVAGELYIGGAGVARGYLRRGDLTAERFLPDGLDEVPGSRVYRTGDLARYLPDRTIGYLGRIDHQVKVRGYRIELGEIEALLLQHPGVRQAVAIVRQDRGLEKELVAYVVVASEGVEPGDLKKYLRRKLPEYMVPTVIVKMDRLPLTSNSKVDRKRLPRPAATRDDSGVAYEKPRGMVEDVVAGIWSDVLGVELIGIRDNFFDLGGHSLLATKAAARIQDALSVQVPVFLIFESPTTADLAVQIQKLIGNGHNEVPSAPTIRRFSRERFRVERP